MKGQIDGIFGSVNSENAGERGGLQESDSGS